MSATPAARQSPATASCRIRTGYDPETEREGASVMWRCLSCGLVMLEVEEAVTPVEAVVRLGTQIWQAPVICDFCGQKHKFDRQGCWSVLGYTVMPPEGSEAHCRAS